MEIREQIEVLKEAKNEVRNHMIGSRESRCKFIDWMISELEKQLKDEEDENI